MVQGEVLWGSLDSARKQAELGLTETWADYTRRFLATDDHVVSTYHTYINPIAGARRECTPKKVPPELMDIAAAQADACEEMLTSLPSVEQSFAELLDGDFTGWGIQEILWALRGDWLMPKQLEWMHPARFRFSSRFEPYLWDRGLALERARELGYENTGGYGRDIVDGLGLPLPQNKYIVHMPRLLPNYPMVSGLFMDIMRPWFVKNWATKFALSGAELAGNPRMLGTLGNDASDEARDALFNALASLTGDSIGVVAGGAGIEILDPKMQGQGGVWEMLLKRCDAAISKAVLGSTLNVEVGDTGGNRALGESQSDTTIAPRWTRSAKLLANTIERQLFQPFLELNRHHFGGHVFVPDLVLHITDVDPEVDSVIVDAGAVTVDELRRSRKLEPLGAERGGDVRIEAKTMPADATIYKADVDAQKAGPAAAPGAPVAADVASNAFNGAQVTSLQGVLASVKIGELAPEAAVIAIRIAFPTVSEQDAVDMVQAQTPGGAATRPFPATRSARLTALSQRLR